MTNQNVTNHIHLQLAHTTPLFRFQVSTNLNFEALYMEDTSSNYLYDHRNNKCDVSNGVKGKFTVIPFDPFAEVIIAGSDKPEGNTIKAEYRPGYQEWDDAQLTALMQEAVA